MACGKTPSPRDTLFGHWLELKEVICRDIDGEFLEQMRPTLIL